MGDAVAEKLIDTALRSRFRRKIRPHRSLSVTELCVESKNPYRGRLAFQLVRSTVGEAGRTHIQGVNGLLGHQDRITGGLGQLLDAGCDVDSIADQCEFQLAPATDGARDHHTGVDADPDS